MAERTQSPPSSAPARKAEPPALDPALEPGIRAPAPNARGDERLVALRARIRQPRRHGRLASSRDNARSLAHPRSDNSLDTNNIRRRQFIRERAHDRRGAA